MKKNFMAMYLVLFFSTFLYGASNHEKLAAKLFPEIYQDVLRYYASLNISVDLKNISEEKGKVFAAEEKNLMLQVYIPEVESVLKSKDAAPKLAKKLKIFAGSYSLGAREMAGIIGCARYVTGWYKNDQTSNEFSGNYFIEALEIYKTFNHRTRGILFEEFDDLYKVFSGKSSAKNDKLIELRLRLSESKEEKSSIAILSDKVAKMIGSEGDGSGKRVWRFVECISGSSLGVCEEFDAPGFLSGVSIYAWYGLNKVKSIFN